MEMPAELANWVLIKIIDTKKKNATDLLVKLLITSNKGNKYIFEIYNCDSNSMLVQPMKSHAYSKFLCVFKDLHNHLLT